MKASRLARKMKFRRKDSVCEPVQSVCEPIFQLLYQLAAFKCRGFRNLGEFIGSIYTRVRAFYDAIASYLEGNLSGVKAPVSPRERPVRKRRLARWKGMPGPARRLEQRQKKAFASLSSTLKSKRSVNSSRALSVHRYGSSTLESSAPRKSRNRLNVFPPRFHAFFPSRFPIAIQKALG